MSRELDREVAEVVMGFREGDIAVLTADDSFIEISEWHPSTDISDAWEVVDRMRERGFDLILASLHGQFAENFWADFSKNNGITGGQAYAEDAPEAICKAALQALEEK